MSIRDTAKLYAGQAFGSAAAQRSKPFLPSDFGELWEIQRNSLAWLITAMQTRPELHTSDVNTIAASSAPAGWSTTIVLLETQCQSAVQHL
jgi:hypothetical protein